MGTSLGYWFYHDFIWEIVLKPLPFKFSEYAPDYDIEIWKKIQTVLK